LDFGVHDRRNTHKWTIAKIYKEKGKSGKNTDRPELQALFGDIQSGKINTVICTKIDRISRSLLDFYKMIELFEQQAVEFISLDENFDTFYPMGRAALKITLVFAEMEREQTSPNARKKKWPGGQNRGFGTAVRFWDSRSASTIYEINFK
jgi:DNA invertase Pin-like site-specific DNA recombinase